MEKLNTIYQIEILIAFVKMILIQRNNIYIPLIIVTISCLLKCATT